MSPVYNSNLFISIVIFWRGSKIKRSKVEIKSAHFWVSRFKKSVSQFVHKRDSQRHVLRMSIYFIWRRANEKEQINRDKTSFLNLLNAELTFDAWILYLRYNTTMSLTASVLGDSCEMYWLTNLTIALASLAASSVHNHPAKASRGTRERVLHSEKVTGNVYRGNCLRTSHNVFPSRIWHGNDVCACISEATVKLIMHTNWKWKLSIAHMDGYAIGCFKTDFVINTSRPS